MKYSLVIAAGMLIAFPLAGPCVPAKAPKKKPAAAIPKEVRRAIQRGIKYLRSKQLADGSWEVDNFSVTRPGGWTCLTMLALLKAGVSPNDKAIKNGLGYLRKLKPSFTYVRALQTMVFVEAHNQKDSELIKRNVKWLLDARIYDGKRFMGWTYTDRKQLPDNSNTFYAVLGLHAGRKGGAPISNNVWPEIREYYLRSQLPDGGWVYARHHNNHSYLTMETAGLSGLLMTGKGLKLGMEIPQQNGNAILVGKGKAKKPFRLALQLIDKDFTIDLKDRVYYNLHGISHLGQVSGLRFLGGQDWYRKGYQFLIKEQNQNTGSWPARGVQFDKWPLLNTSFALLFLSSGPK